jgi:hypothetical protein
MQAREPENSVNAKNFTSLKEIDTFVKQTSDLLLKLALEGKFADKIKRLPLEAQLLIRELQQKPSVGK